MVPTRKCQLYQAEGGEGPPASTFQLLSAGALSWQDHLVEGVLRFGCLVPVIMSLCYKHVLNASVS